MYWADTVKMGVHLCQRWTSFWECVWVWLKYLDSSQSEADAHHQMAPKVFNKKCLEKNGWHLACLHGLSSFPSANDVNYSALPTQQPNKNHCGTWPVGSKMVQVTCYPGRWSNGMRRLPHFPGCWGAEGWCWRMQQSLIQCNWRCEVKNAEPQSSLRPECRRAVLPDLMTKHCIHMHSPSAMRK